MLAHPPILARREISIGKLPKIDFDFSGFSKWRESNVPLVVEIGCGVGLHPIRWSQANPDRQMLAVERTREKFAKFNRRLTRHSQIDNLWTAHAEAAVLLPQLLEPASVDEYFMLYPNPEPKAPNRRLAYSPLLKFICSSLRPGGVLCVATNVESYAQELATRADQAGFARPEVSVVAPDARPRSHFEKKYLERGERCWNVTLQK
jgi:tRNA (guanine-N7-)-methyltransferase